MVRLYYTPLLTVFLLYTAKLLIITTTGQMSARTRHPEYINCSLPESENIVVTKGHGTVQRCENGRLEIKFCFAGIERGVSQCVEHETARKIIEKLPDGHEYFLDRFNLRGSRNRLVDCQKVMDEQADTFFLSPNKTGCLAGLGEVVRSTQKLPGHIELCLTSRHRIMHIEEGNVAFCEDYNFQIRKCVMIVDGRYKCISKEYLATIPGLHDVYEDSFCSRFVQQPSLYVPEYMKYLEDCSIDIPDPIYSQPGQKTDTPQFIDCSLTHIGQDFGKQVVIRDEMSWYECSNGQLKLTQCITSSDENIYRCVSRESFKRYEEVGFLGRPAKQYYVNKNTENDLNCSLVVSFLKRRHPLKVDEECSTSTTAVTREHGNNTSALCVSDSQVIYSIVGHSFYECDGPSLKLTKCMIYTDGEYLCVSKESATAILNFPPSSDDEVCNEFAAKYETLKTENVMNTMVCNTPLEVSHRRGPVTPAPSARVPYRPTRKITTVTASVSTTLDPRTCSLTPNKSTIESGVNIRIPGKCINIDDFVRKLDNMTPAQFASKINYIALAGTAVDLWTTAMDMNIGELWKIVQMGFQMLLNTPATEAIIKFIQMLKTGLSDCDVLRNYMIFDRSELCDLIKNCDESKPAPPLLFCYQRSKL